MRDTPTSPEASARRRRTRIRQGAGALLAGFCAIILAREFTAATDFPTGELRHRVDGALVAHLRANPGLHLGLAKGWRLETPLDLRDDPFNRRVFGTSFDRREAVPTRSIHIQQKGDLIAIHTDANNPRFGLVPNILHHILDVPIVPLCLGLIGGLALLYPGRQRPGPSSPDAEGSTAL